MLPLNGSCVAADAASAVCGTLHELASPSSPFPLASPSSSPLPPCVGGICLLLPPPHLPKATLRHCSSHSPLASLSTRRLPPLSTRRPRLSSCLFLPTRLLPPLCVSFCLFTSRQTQLGRERLRPIDRTAGAWPPALPPSPFRVRVSRWPGNALARPTNQPTPGPGWQPVFSFGVPLVTAQLDIASPGVAKFLHHDVVQLFREWRAADPVGRALSNAGGGWQSQADLFATFGRLGAVPTAELDTAVRLHSMLRMLTYAAVVDESTSLASQLWKFLDRGDSPRDVDLDDVIIQDAWANVNAPHQYNTKHGHGHLLAGVLYVANTEGCPEDDDGGWLEFFDPRVQVSSADAQWWGHYGAFRIKPRDGLVVLFPGCVHRRSRQGAQAGCAGCRLTAVVAAAAPSNTASKSWAERRDHH